MSDETAPFITPGIHHVTAIAGKAQAAIEFHARTLGLRLVKRTVNFDDPQTYHLYFGDAAGRPGSIVSLFPWPGAGRGERGDGEAQRIALRVPQGSLDYWSARLSAAGLEATAASRFGEESLRFDDPDGIPLELTASGPAGAGSWSGSGIPGEVAVAGVHGVVLSAPRLPESVAVLTAACGMAVAGVEPTASGSITRLRPGSGGDGGYIDLVEVPSARRGRWGAGSIHHVALRAADEADQDRARDALREHGLQVGEYKDRCYFRSLYFSEPSGSVLEIATDGPGFAVDEPPDELGLAFRLPHWLESDRAFLRARLAVTASPEYADRFGSPGVSAGRA